MSNEPFKHALAAVQTEHVGTGTRIWQFVVVLPGAHISSDVNICSNCFIENDVIIGDRVTIKNGVQLRDGQRVEDDVFVSPNVSFKNDRYPKSGQRPREILQAVIGIGTSIGAGAVICPGLTVDAGAMVAAGAVVVRDVPSGAMVMGNPAEERSSGR